MCVLRALLLQIRLLDCDCSVRKFGGAEISQFQADDKNSLVLLSFSESVLVVRVSSSLSKISICQIALQIRRLSPYWCERWWFDWL